MLPSVFAFRHLHLFFSYSLVSLGHILSQTHIGMEPTRIQPRTRNEERDKSSSCNHKPCTGEASVRGPPPASLESNFHIVVTRTTQRLTSSRAGTHATRPRAPATDRRRSMKEVKRTMLQVVSNAATCHGRCGQSVCGVVQDQASVPVQRVHAACASPVHRHCAAHLQGSALAQHAYSHDGTRLSPLSGQAAKS